MAYPKATFATFEDYLAYSDEMGLVGRFQSELVLAVEHLFEGGLVIAKEKFWSLVGR